MGHGTTRIVYSRYKNNNMTSIEKLVYNLVYNNLVDNSPNSKLWEIVKQAKETHRNEIEEAFYSGNQIPGNWEDDSTNYYNETYKRD